MPGSKSPPSEQTLDWQGTIPGPVSTARQTIGRALPFNLVVVVCAAAPQTPARDDTQERYAARRSARRCIGNDLGSARMKGNDLDLRLARDEQRRHSLANDQSRGDVLTGIIGAHRALTVSMISALSIPCRLLEVRPPTSLLPPRR
jgi:hypothetical protein